VSYTVGFLSAIVVVGFRSKRVLEDSYDEAQRELLSANKAIHDLQSQLNKLNLSNDEKDRTIREKLVETAGLQQVVTRVKEETDRLHKELQQQRTELDEERKNRIKLNNYNQVR
jgi:chromosome segregation ATPase